MVWLPCRALGPLINGPEGTGYKRGQKWARSPVWGHVLTVECERVLVPYFKEVNALFETDRNVGSLPAVAGL